EVERGDGRGSLGLGRGLQALLLERCEEEGVDGVLDPRAAGGNGRANGCLERPVLRRGGRGVRIRGREWQRGSGDGRKNENGQQVPEHGKARAFRRARRWSRPPGPPPGRAPKGPN